MIHAAIQDFLNTQVEEGLIAGALVGTISHNGQENIYSAGFADKERKTPMLEDTQFWIASCSKPIAAVAIMSAVEEGLLDLDSKLADHIPVFRKMRLQTAVDEDGTQTTVPIATNITLRQCLCHTTGFPFLSTLELQHGIDYLPLNEAVISYAMSPLLFEPGTNYSYGNMGINSVCYILEGILGKDFDSYMQERVLGPLGMKNTSMWLTNDNESKRALCYAPHENEEKLIPHDVHFLNKPYSNKKRTQHPGGAYFSCMQDLLKFCSFALHEGTYQNKAVLSPKYFREMTSSQTRLAEYPYGLCWAVDEHGYGHGGAAGTHFRIEPESGKACVYLIQQRGQVGRGHQHILPELHELVFGKHEKSTNLGGLV